MDENSPIKRLSPEEMRALFAKLMSEDTIAAVCKDYLEEEGIPLKDIIAEMEEIHRRYEEERK